MTLSLEKTPPVTPKGTGTGTSFVSEESPGQHRHDSDVSTVKW